MAGAAFLIRVFSAGLIYLSQILLARWMGSFEFGIYVYVWTLVSVIGDLSDLGFATSTQRFVPAYAKRGHSTCCAVSCREAAGSRSPAPPSSRWPASSRSVCWSRI